jgi:hypothetical protein
MKKIKMGIVLTALSLMGMAFCGCGAKEDTGEQNEVSNVSVSQGTMMKSAEVTGTYHDGIYNDLTGEYSTDRTEEYGRPVAIMINNISDAMPQSGVGSADIIYEFTVEGGITRLLAIFNDYSSLEKVGSIRSCRPYYVTTAMEFDAIYMHYGESPQGTEEIDATGIDHISGLSSESGIAFYRSSDRVAPHNVFSSGDMINAAIEYLGFETKHSDSFQSKFKFNDEDTASEGTTANKVTLNISNYTQPWFEYDSENKVYKRFQYGAEHIDDLTGEQLTFKNIIIQFAHYTSIDDHDRQEIDLVGSGSGYYISDGVAVPISWKKASDSDVTKYTTEDGEELKLNPGKTYVSVFESEKPEGVVIE